MNKQLNKTGVIVLVIAAIFSLNFISCTKDAVKAPGQDKISTAVQSNATTNDQELTDLFVFIPCANGGAGEDVHLTGYLHIVTSLTINGNNVRGKVHYQPQGIKGVGDVTGDKYNATGVTQDEFKGSLVNGQYEETSVNNFRIIGQGNGNNYLVHEVFHVTVNANGVVRVLFDKLRVDCK
jgi:hypothetical protein